MAKAIFPTAKCLQCVAHGKLHTANKRRQRAPLPSVFLRALGKYFPKTKKIRRPHQSAAAWRHQLITAVGAATALPPGPSAGRAGELRRQGCRRRAGTGRPSAAAHPLASAVAAPGHWPAPLLPPAGRRCCRYPPAVVAAAIRPLSLLPPSACCRCCRHPPTLARRRGPADKPPPDLSSSSCWLRLATTPRRS